MKNQPLPSSDEDEHPNETYAQAKARQAQELKEQETTQLKTMELNQETRALKEKLLEQVEEIIARQNRVEPVNLMETFQIETASRKVLRELIEDFRRESRLQNDKIKGIGDQFDQHKRKVDSMDFLMKRLQTSTNEANKYGNRITKCESNLDAIRENFDKKNEHLKDYIAKMKEMLEVRIDQITQFESQIEGIGAEIKKLAGMMTNEQNKIITELAKTNQFSLVMRGEIDQHFQTFESQQLSLQFYQDKTDSWQKSMMKKYEQQQAFFEGKFENIHFEISRRVRTDDMKQNFKQLNDILLIKFKQLEDTKEATRNLITYQKYFHPVQTQQMISENIMQLKAAQDDENYINFQQNLYRQINEKVRLECKMAAKIFDYDLKAHLESLEAHQLKGNQDFQPYPLKDVQHEFVMDLLVKYLSDIKRRMKQGEYGRATSSTLLRKCVKLDDIEYLVEDCFAKTDKLLSQVEKIAEELAEKRHRKTIDRNIKNLVYSRVEYKPSRCFKRKESWKGRSARTFNGYGKDALEDQVRGLGRPKSRNINRTNAVRNILHEHLDISGGQRQTLGSLAQADEDALFSANDGRVPNQRKDSSTSVAGPETPVESGVGVNVELQFKQMLAMFQGGGAKDGANISSMLAGGQSTSMDRQDKRKLINEIKDEMKIMITQISDYQVEQAVAIVKTQIRQIQVDNDLDKKRIVQQFEEEIKNLTEYFKQQVMGVRSDFEEEMRQIQKMRCRDKSDNDQMFSNHLRQIESLQQGETKHDGYLNVVAQAISLLTENINMQMEAEFADQFDRQLISLYGAKNKLPDKMDQVGTGALNKIKKDKQHATGANTQSEDKDKQLFNTNSNSKAHLGTEANTNTQYNQTTGNTTLYNGKINQAHFTDLELTGASSNQEVTGGKIHFVENESSIDHYLDQDMDNIRETSGVNIQRHDIPIQIDTQCLSHQINGKETQLTLKLFKIACLAYKPSNVKYRTMAITRNQMIKLRRGLVDRISSLLPNCQLFKENAIYPRRYYDDLMVDYKIQQRSLQGMTQESSKFLGTSDSFNLPLNENSSKFLPEIQGQKSIKKQLYDQERQFLNRTKELYKSIDASQRSLTHRQKNNQTEVQSMLMSPREAELGASRHMPIPALDDLSLNSIIGSPTMKQHRFNQSKRKEKKRGDGINLDIDSLIKVQSNNIHRMNQMTNNHFGSMNQTIANQNNTYTDFSPARKITPNTKRQGGLVRTRNGPGVNHSMVFEKHGTFSLNKQQFETTQPSRGRQSSGVVKHANHLSNVTMATNLQTPTHILNVTKGAFSNKYHTSTSSLSKLN